MGGVTSQPMVTLPPGSQASLNINRLASLAARYEQLKRDFSSIQNEHEAHSGDLRQQRDQFRQQLAQFQKDFEAKLAEQQKRNADLNARERNVAAKNSQLKEKLAAIESRQAENSSAAANARAAAVKTATEAAAAEKLKLEEVYKKELAEIEAPLQAAREEFSRITADLKDMEAKTAAKPQLNEAISKARANKNALNSNIASKQTRLREIDQNVEAARSRALLQIKEEEAKLPARMAELETKLKDELEASREQQVKALDLELRGIREGAERESDALLEKAKAESAEALAAAAQEIAMLRQKEEVERASRLAAETADLEREKAAAAKERAETEAAIRALEVKAATNAVAARQLAEEKAELERIKAEQAEFESEKARILAEQAASRDAAEVARKEAAEARAAADKAAAEKAAADQERVKAEKIEKYRKHLYQIIKDWIGPLDTERRIRTFHDDVKDDYFFQDENGVKKDWVQEKTILELKRKYPYLVWQPRPDFETFVGGRRSRRNTRRSRRRGRRQNTRKI